MPTALGSALVPRRARLDALDRALAAEGDDAAVELERSLAHRRERRHRHLAPALERPEKGPLRDHRHRRWA